MSVDAETVYIGLGSNLEDPRAQILQAFKELDRLPSTELLARSSLYTSSPLGPSDQPDYINAVACLQTGLKPLQLLDALQALEQSHRRVRERHWGPRTLDLDILLFGDRSIDLPRLQVPHPHMHSRSFVLQPLLEISPGVVVPGRGEARILLAECDQMDLKRLPH